MRPVTGLRSQGQDTGRGPVFKSGCRSDGRARRKPRPRTTQCNHEGVRSCRDNHVLAAAQSKVGLRDPGEDR